ncbi:response regulator transcription factor [Mesorhizobium sp. M1396]|uniref:response regulator transcription factor n=1 Tax=Mesorhizobium sp. M1396 TaxID=2957095 RepID=UPI00333DEA25
MKIKPETTKKAIEARRVRVVVAERNPLVISALREMLDCDGRFELVASVQSGRHFLDLAAEAEFDVAVIGWKLADMDGSDVLAEVQSRKFDVRITVFSNDHDIGILKQCVRLGAQGYCFQFDDPPIIFDTILAVAHGRICIPYIDINKVNDTPLSQLTVRERELLAVLSDGWTNLQIATRTGISENTVKYHLKNLYDKLDVRNRAMAVALYSSERRRSPKQPFG